MKFILFAILFLSTVDARGCDPGLKPTIYDDNDCTDVNTAQTNMVDTRITSEFIKNVNKCDYVESNGEIYDIIINCN